MFADTLLESGVARRTGRGWATMASFTVQALAIAVLAVIPSLYPEVMALHRAAPVSVPIYSEPLPQVTPSPTTQASGGSAALVHSTPVINVRDSGFHYGPVQPQAEAEPIPAPNPGIGNPSGLPFTALNGNRISIPKPEPPSRPMWVSAMNPGDLIRQVQPVYPHIAVQTRTEGAVTLTAIISKSGEIESLHVVSGHPLLVGAAREAIRQWRYRPYILNGEPVEVETQITVNFKLN
jgi:periplasmic protein TonB